MLARVHWRHLSELLFQLNCILGDAHFSVVAKKDPRIVIKANIRESHDKMKSFRFEIELTRQHLFPDIETFWEDTIHRAIEQARFGKRAGG